MTHGLEQMELMLSSILRRRQRTYSPILHYTCHNTLRSSVQSACCTYTCAQGRIYEVEIGSAPTSTHADVVIPVTNVGSGTCHQHGYASYCCMISSMHYPHDVSNYIRGETGSASGSCALAMAPAESYSCFGPCMGTPFTVSLLVSLPPLPSFPLPEVNPQLALWSGDGSHHRVWSRR
jgi:hypothetical protein